MAGFFEETAEDITPIVVAALKEVEEFLASNGHDNLMRRFQAQYDKLSVEDLSEIQIALGHQDGEDPPCKACKIMAAKEVQLDQEA